MVWFKRHNMMLVIFPFSIFKTRTDLKNFNSLYKRAPNTFEVIGYFGDFDAVLLPSVLAI